MKNLHLLITLKGYYASRHTKPFYIWIKEELQRDEPQTPLKDLVARVLRVNVGSVEPKWLYI